MYRRIGGSALNWTDFVGQLTGGALGVLIGYLASEYLAGLQRDREEDLARVAVNAEFAQNVAEAGWFIHELQQAESLELDPSKREEVRGRAFADLRRPTVTSLAWDSHFIRSPDAFSAYEVERMLDYYRAAREVAFFWDEYRIDRQRDHDHFLNVAPIDPFANGTVSIVPPNYLGRKIRKLQYRLDQALERAGQRDGSGLADRLPPRVSGWSKRKATMGLRLRDIATTLRIRRP